MLGFDANMIPLSSDNLAALGISSRTKHPHLALGVGGLRAFVFEVNPPDDLRETINSISHRLVANRPQLLWMVIAVDRGRQEIGLAAVDGSGPRARVAALIAHRGLLVDSDSETLCALAAARTESDLFTHCRWVEILGRESVSRRFFRTLERIVACLANSLHPRLEKGESSELALLYASRLLFLSFLETKGWLNRDHGFLANRYADCMVSGGRYHQRVLAPLFFGTLNTIPANRSARARAFGRVPFLNGGLFGRSALERRTSRSWFSDEALGDLFGELLTRYRFTAREDTTMWSEAAIDPEMLGKAFESLMSSRDRKKSGAFYTPQSLVAQLTAAALAHRLASPAMSPSAVLEALAGETVARSHRPTLLKSIGEVTILDPACGSGAFLVHALEELSRLRVRLGDTTALHEIRRRILTASIFGVDINPTAVWLCELRLWLSMAIEDPETEPLRVTPLPNLDRNIRIGDSLSGDDFRVPSYTPGGISVAKLRMRYARSTGPRKRSLARALDVAERGHAKAANARRVAVLRAERRDILSAARSRNLFGERPAPPVEAKRRLIELRGMLRDALTESRRIVSGGALPFSFVSGFADVAARGGFEVVIGNPPWIRTHHFDKASRVSLRLSFDVYRNAAWRGGSDAASAGRGFASQVDAAALFIERSMELLRPEGVAALIVPAKLWRSLAGGGVRDLLVRRTGLLELHDLSDASAVFDAAVYPSLVITSRKGLPAAERPGNTSVVAHRDGQPERWITSPDRICLDSTPGSPWILIPPKVRCAFDAIAAAGIPLCQSVIGRPLLGVKTGCNDAFVVQLLVASNEGSTAFIRNSRGEGEIECGVLRPLIRGETVKPWLLDEDEHRIIWTHDDTGAPRVKLPPLASRWLSPWRRDLESRTDSRSGRTWWWSVFRVESADCSRPRVVWADIGRTPTAAVLRAGDPSIPINSCYVARCPTHEDACTLAAIMNSDVAAAWLSVIAEPARGGYRRYMGWTMALLPIPRDWERARSLLAPIAMRALCNKPPSPAVLRAAVLDAYRLDEATVSALLAWSG
jgi:methylase of polypeptide subunit release factors